MTSVPRAIQMGNFNAPHYQRITCMAHDSVKTLISNAKVGSVWDTLLVEYSGTPLNGHPSKADTHDITDNSESPDCPPIHFNT